MKSIEIFVNRYNEDHDTVLSRILRCIAIILMNLGVFCLLWSLPDQPIKDWMGDRIFSNWATVYAVLLILYYGSESFSLTFGGGVYLLTSLFVTQRISYFYEPGPLQAGLFLVSAALLFFLTGRIITKSLTNYHRDLVYLPLQPVWILSYVYRWIGVKI